MSRNSSPLSTAPLPDWSSAGAGALVDDLAMDRLAGPAIETATLRLPVRQWEVIHEALAEAVIDGNMDDEWGEDASKVAAIVDQLINAVPDDCISVNELCG